MPAPDALETAAPIAVALATAFMDLALLTTVATLRAVSWTLMSSFSFSTAVLATVVMFINASSISISSSHDSCVRVAASRIEYPILWRGSQMKW
jgi:hypothetical protein